MSPKTFRMVMIGFAAAVVLIVLLSFIIIPRFLGRDMFAAAHSSPTIILRSSPAINGDKIVWVSQRDGVKHIDLHVHDLLTGKESSIALGSGNRSEPMMYGNTIAYVGGQKADSTDIYVYRLDTGKETRITSNGSGNKSDLHIYKDKITWVDDRNNGNDDIYMYDLSAGKETRITIDPQVPPNTINRAGSSIYGDTIVWQDNRNGNWDIYMYNLSTGKETNLTPESGDHQFPAIYGNRIVWSDEGTSPGIYQYDLGTGQKTKVISTPDTEPIPTAIYEDTIAWVGGDVGGSNIHLYNLRTGKESQMTAEVSSEDNLQIDGDTIVWLDMQNENSVIYMYNLRTGKETQLAQGI